ncbi:hypothetical protein LVY75_34310 (plasmid) [Sinorhizobium sp. B11]
MRLEPGGGIDQEILGLAKPEAIELPGAHPVKIEPKIAAVLGLHRMVACLIKDKPDLRVCRCPYPKGNGVGQAFATSAISPFPSLVKIACLA